MSRKLDIKEFISKSLLEFEYSRLELSDLLEKADLKVSKSTLNRILSELLEDNVIEHVGQGKNLHYKLRPSQLLLLEYDLEKYFQTPHVNRVIYESFQDRIFDSLKDNWKYIFSKQEKNKLTDLQKEFEENYQKISYSAKAKEMERLCIELAWKSSSIEGNTYTLLETETLIKTKVEAAGHQRNEAIMILNHKNALDYILQNKKEFIKISPEKIINLHSILIEGLYVEKGIRQELIGITGTKYRPPANSINLERYIQDISNLINQVDDINLKAIFALLTIAYTQMFMDGNKRTSRMLANAILIAHDCCPLSFGSLDETEYKQALVLFYEKNNLSNFKRIYLEQLEFAIKNFFL